MLLWVQFLMCTGIIILAGTRLSIYGDIIAEKTGLGRTWVGLIMLASVTSLPELITGVSSVTVYDLPNIAVGDILGSCMFNMLIIAFLDFKVRSTPISTTAHHGQVLSATFGVLLLGLVSLGIATESKVPVVGWIGLYSVLFLTIYAIAMRLVYLYEQKRLADMFHDLAAERQYDHISKEHAYWLYSINAVVVIIAAAYLPYLGDKIAEVTGLGRTFVGSFFIAVSTSLPELVVSFSALKIGGADMALGNLFGSNLFNIGILAIDDLLYINGPLLSHISVTHLISANAAIVMTSIAAIGLTYRASRKFFVIAWDSLGLVAVYVLATWAMYLNR